jgi:hypothetical protein
MPKADHIPRDPAPDLEQDAKNTAQVEWHLLMCQHCGTIHPGMCPRVRHFRTEVKLPGGVTEIREFDYHDNDEWEPPPGARTMQDVFGPTKIAPAPPQPPPPEPKGTKR